MFRTVRLKDALFHLLFQPCTESGGISIQLFTQQTIHGRNKCACLGSKQIYDGTLPIRQGERRGIADIKVMCRHLPCALLADRPTGVCNGWQRAASPADKLRHGQRTKCAAADKIRRFVVVPVSCSGKIQPKGQRQLWQCILVVQHLAACTQPAFGTGKCTPHLPLREVRKQFGTLRRIGALQ